jgi:hypothetical protein
VTRLLLAAGAFIAVTTGLAFAALSAGYARVHIDDPVPFGPSIVEAVAGRFAAEVLGAPVTPTAVVSPETPAGLTAWVYAGGKAVASVSIDTQGGAAGTPVSSLEALVVKAVAALNADKDIQALDAGAKAAASIRFDLVRARKKIPDTLPLWRALSLAPGADGAAVKTAQGFVDVPADVLVHRGAFFKGYRLYKGVPFELGADLKAVARIVGKQAKVGEADIAAGKVALYRVVAESHLVRGAAAQPIPVVGARAGVVAPLTKSAAIAAAKAGGDWLVQHTEPDGRFSYIYFPDKDQVDMRDYNLPRHGGTTYSLFLLYDRTKDPVYAEAGLRGAQYIVNTLQPAQGAEGRVFALPKDRIAKMGSAGLALSALAYARLTGHNSPEIIAASRDLAAYAVSLQKDDGDFVHYYDVKKGVEAPGRVIYYNGEVLVGLGLMARLEPENPRWKAATEKGLDFLTGPRSQYFMREFFPISDSWVCTAIDEFRPVMKKPAWAEYARMVAHTYTDTQMWPGETGYPYMVGGYGAGLLFLPRTTPGSTNLEGLVSALVTAEDTLGTKEPRLREGLAHGLRYLVQMQFSAEDGYRYPNPVRVAGGFRHRLGFDEIRNDYVQHALSALIRGADYLPETTADAATPDRP